METMTVRIQDAELRDRIAYPMLATLLLSFTAGFVDTVGFAALFGLFTAHVTGNFILIGHAIVHDGHAIFLKLAALPVFIVAVAATRLWVASRERAGRGVRFSLLLAEAILLAGVLAAGVAASPVLDPNGPLAILAGFLAVAAMALQNAGGRLAFTALAPTTVMTGNVTQAVIDGVDILFRIARQPEETKARFRKTWPAVLAFAAGATIGALGFVAARFACLLVPIAALSVLAILTGKRSL